jgi:hypothetical protein
VGGICCFNLQSTFYRILKRLFCIDFDRVNTWRWVTGMLTTPAVTHADFCRFVPVHWLSHDTGTLIFIH